MEEKLENLMGPTPGACPLLLMTMLDLLYRTHVNLLSAYYRNPG